MDGSLAQPLKIGAAAPRVDGRLKVTGEARYASDMPLADPAYAFFATSAIARGRIATIDDREARGVPGVIDILTHQNASDAIKQTKLFSDGGYVGSTIMPLGSDRVFYGGQIVAVVLAETFEAAREAAHRLKISYAPEPPAAGFDSPGAATVAAKDASPNFEDPKVGDAESAFSSAPVTVDQHYATPTQHHNPIELFTTSCAWAGGKLTVWEGSQNVTGLKHGLAEQLDIDADKIHVVSPYVGGAFGSRGTLTQRTALIAVAAKRLNRPVKLVATRDQGFTIATYRAETRHHFRLGADRDGKLVALIHEGEEVTSRPDNYKVAGTDATTRLYACPNIASKVSIVRADRNTPGFMRSPPEVPYLFALESAMDELAVALDMDPVELRRRNDTDHEPIRNLPYTSRSLIPCFEAAAKSFGWEHRNAQPGAMHEDDWLIGWGCAATMYPTQLGPATARVTLTPRGTARVQTAAHEIGNGAYTVIALTASDKLGIAPDKIIVELGDSNLPPAPVAGGSNTTASVCNAVAKGCEQIRARIAAAAAVAGDGPFMGKDPATLVLADGRLKGPDSAGEPLDAAFRRVSNGVIEAYAENIPHGVPPEGLAKLYQGHVMLAGGAKMKDRIQFAFGAEFVEVRVHSRTREIRVPRVVGAFAAGQIVNATTAKSQLMGGLIWGVSSALHEATEIDRRYARYTNTDLAEYMVPVNADVGRAEVILVPENDREVNPLGIKGLGELGNVGTNAAVANAVYHATGIRVREPPIRLEKLLDAPTISL
ncbi:MAG TPA: xanthine dehydrogenase family protein molybdopterin-binding subunit [Stellaceae bacterium]|jgi:xanthine dehydrogenase YagR molybdenum-binding subunit|nr:xanthine dehydrogenase family protein molybdopterin-binding subunit [Stellaceae bacterium]